MQNFGLKKPFWENSKMKSKCVKNQQSVRKLQPAAPSPLFLTRDAA